MAKWRIDKRLNTDIPRSWDFAMDPVLIRTPTKTQIAGYLYSYQNNCIFIQFQLSGKFLGIRYSLAMNEKITDRSQQVLKSLVELYIRKGQPVGSKALVEEAHLPVSAATVRNVMAELEQQGLITSPHTSSGRIPTATGYRLFVDSLISVQPLSESTLSRLQTDLDPQQGAKELIATTSRLLSDITCQAGVVTLPRREQVILRQLEFLPLSDNRVLVVLVANKQEVQNRIIHTHRNYSRKELADAARFLNEHFSGQSLEKARTELLSSMDRDRAQMDSLMRTVVEVAEQALQTEKNESDYILTGQASLIQETEHTNVGKIRSLLEAFNEKREILHLLDHCVNASGVQIFIGQESGYQVLDDYSVITAPYEEGGQIVGVLGVVGPTRMAYDRVIPIVDATAKILSTVLDYQ
jgi:heat-inducible transcriptional repressor